MNSETVFLKRFLHTSPVLIALVFHAIALNRWLVVGPAIAVLSIAVLRNPGFAPSSRHWYLAAIAGALIGLFAPPGMISAGPLPPGIAAVVAGIAIAIAIVATFGNRTTVAWVAAWAILAMSGKHGINGQLNFVLFIFLAVSLIAAASNAKVLRYKSRSSLVRSLLAISIFAAITAVCTVGASFALKRIDRALVNTVENLMTRNPTSSITGLSSNITLGERSQIRPSPLPLLELSEMSGVLRTKVMDDFDGLRWTTSAQLNSATNSFDEVAVHSGPKRQIEMLFLDDINNAIPSPAGTYQVIDATPRISGGWVLQGEPDRVTVTLVGSADETLPSEPEPIKNLTALPDVLREGLGPIAAELTVPTNTNRENALAIAAFFQNNFEYSLTTDLSGEDHPLVILVKQRRPAYCVYFASAMAVMLRSQGIPARVASGFVPNEVNPLTGRVTIRERDSHAWVEVWSPENKRYDAFDPTPGSSRLQTIGLDEPESYLANLVQAIRSTVRRLWLIARQDPIRLLSMLITSPYAWLTVVALTVWGVYRFRRSQPVRSRAPVDSVDPDLREIYSRYLQSLKQFGINPGDWESDQELIDRLEEMGEPSRSKSANEFIDRYRAARYGGQVFDDELVALVDRMES
ncbi:Protein-glutamine gamma-glutamyltransferase [Rubripirellula obstinata]|uniref:Protein-glutamine gamma-glutamyltransferase n=1 Tax=Rubripirellula obstinata TaxID=406547 RepID=A0A5B1CG30_9BACT|nr:transglutaminase domain-containing protein [Rubripirellula obstinata]KAA1258530.1 Protein-glutamine gamma-glutamyltransferase [Rubripirellula obstinata]